MSDGARALVCLTAGRGIFARAIRFLTKSDVNHAFIAYKSDDWGGWWAVQIDERGVVKIPVEQIKHKYIECYDMGMSLKPAFKMDRSLYGERYDWLGILGFLFKLVVWRSLGKVIGNPLHRKGELFCSEYVTAFLQLVPGMYDSINALKPSQVAPGGSPRFLGSPSLSWILQSTNGVKRVFCPWAKMDGY